MDFRQFAGQVDISQVNPRILTQQPIIVIPEEWEWQSTLIGHVLPRWSTVLSDEEQCVVLESPKDEPFQCVHVPFADFTELQFTLLTRRAESDIIESLNRGDINRSLSRLGQLFAAARSYITRTPEASVWVFEKVGAMRARLPLEEIANALGADSYFISVFPPGVGFNFPADKVASTAEATDLIAGGPNKAIESDKQ